ncbi:hypothetical protein BX616_005139 [Lobosporangium transversale]|uniref:Uncharacterized protein n=1 Tax=Lobosporangium transversale TaxID=64571 RepID=A0A1Y2GJ91_9FUNG|nr:hypothetical protein BCR41DRAFT_356194 [Lobosporangium transversale]KAF9897692.1 hypothetical protein BX616_005139 [Lobosporangium transversale]ORZ12509.1 hypothetical protein BCR41DRAFT_356194 [Lobosporangium transversale]|eukprot:XP_021880128.1 hypothetical protein BCR41DRAFT_356194 [Lobosporangium transversale]
MRVWKVYKGDLLLKNFTLSAPTSTSTATPKLEYSGPLVNNLLSETMKLSASVLILGLVAVQAVAAKPVTTFPVWTTTATVTVTKTWVSTIPFPTGTKTVTVTRPARTTGVSTVTVYPPCPWPTDFPGTDYPTEYPTTGPVYPTPEPVYPTPEPVYPTPEPVYPTETDSVIPTRRPTTSKIRPPRTSQLL